MLTWLKIPGPSDVEERRKLARRECHCEVAGFTPIEGAPVLHEFKGVVSDIGVGGMRLRCYEPMPRDTRVFVEFQEELPGVLITRIQCSVIWSYKSKARLATICGLRYDDSQANMRRSWVKFVLEDVGFTPETMNERRRTIRVRSALPVRLFAHDASLGVEMEAAGSLTNLSPEGALAETLEPILEGRKVQITFQSEKLKGLKVNGVVATVNANRGTRRFLHSIAFDELDSAQAKALRGQVYRLIKSFAPDKR